MEEIYWFGFSFVLLDNPYPNAIILCPKNDVKRKILKS